MIGILSIDREPSDTESHPLKFLNKLLDIKGDLNFDCEIDKIYIIVDRDKNSFKENQFQEFIKKCENHSIDVALTNPCFELWLLCHFDSFNNYCPIDLFHNKKITKKKKYLEKAIG